MSYMPAFTQSPAGVSPQLYVEDDAWLLRDRCREGLVSLFARANLAAEEGVYESRLESELEIIERKQYGSYFLIVADYIAWAASNGIGVGPGRGSGPCSLVGYVLGITKVDPVRYHLPFERFVNPERNVVPDFDVDFCEERYAEVSEYILKRYGQDYVARISSDDGVPLSGRLVISDRPLCELVPVELADDASMPVIRMNAAQVNARGLVRFNVIRQQAVTVIQNKVDELRQAACPVDIDKVPLNCEKTYDLLCKGEFADIQLIESNAWETSVRTVQPRKFSDLTAAVAFSFPFLQGTLEEFVGCKRHAESIEYVHPALEKVTGETYGLILYQEQFMRIAHDIGGLTMANADLFRRALKRHDEDKIAIHKIAFIDGAVRFGLSHKQATGLFDQLAVAGCESVTKAHAVSYALMAYQGVWLEQRLENSR